MEIAEWSACWCEKERLKLKLQSWFEKNLIVCLRWNDQYDERMVVIQMVVI